MFTWLNKQGVRSSLGFEVQGVNLFTIRYTEGKRFVNVHVEDGFAGRPCISISDSAFSKWDNSTVNNSIEEQQRIRRNFCEAMEFQGIAVK